MTANNRPRGRKRTEATSSGGVNKRGEGLNTGKVGNADYSGRKTGQSPRRSSGVTRGAGGIGVLALIAYLLFGNLGGGAGGGTAAPTPTPKPAQPAVVTPTPTPKPTANTASTVGHFNPPVTTYTDTNTSTVDETVNGKARDKFTKLKGNGNDTATILIYMCATDLEANYGMATSDINEMATAAQSDKVNVIIETGGTKKWQNNVMSTATNERWKVAQNSLIALDRNVGRKQMTSPNTLKDFIEWGVKEYPADRYMLIFWDHGGGSIQGYGYDQIYPNATMTVDQISQVLKSTGVKFDFVGFDACLMANVETAVAVSPYADYMIASEETEPGTGWYYTDWLTTLAKNSSTPTPTLAKEIVDTFIARSGRNEKTSLSLVDLAEFEANVPSALSAFAKTITTAVNSNAYRTIANARSQTKEYAQSNKIDQVDLVHFCQNVNSKEAQDLITAIKGCVKYNRVYNMTNSSGLSIYFPYRSTSRVSAAARLYDSLGMDSSYTDAIRSFATMETSGQVVTGNNSNPLYSILGGQPSYSSQQVVGYEDILSLLMNGGSQQSAQSGYGSLEQLLGGSYGVQPNSLDLFAQMLGGRAEILDTTNLVLSEVNGHQVLSLSQEQWDLINDVELNVWINDGSGYIDLGLDNVFELDEEGNLLVEYDGLWTAIDDQVVSYYVRESEFYDDGGYAVEGYVPALVNGERANFVIRFTDEAPEGTVIGAQKVYEEGIEAKGYMELNEGDEISFICDYYDYDGNYQNTYELGDAPLKYDGELTVSTYEITGEDVLFGYRLTDIYNANTFTPMLNLD